MSIKKNIPTSDLDTFKKQLDNPNKSINGKQQINKLIPIEKNIVISLVSDYTGCGHIRNILPSTYINSIFGPSHNMNIITTPVPILDVDILKRTRTVFFQRTMGESAIALVEYYKKLQYKYKYKMVYDIDDFIWDGDDDTEEIPEYNFGKDNLHKVIQDSSITVMKMMDTVCVTTQFLKDYIHSKGIAYDSIEIVHNTVPSFLWGSDKKEPITTDIKKPHILWSASPTHWNNEKKLYGDMDNAWRTWIIKNVKAGKIEYTQMGGLPWFFEEIKDDINVLSWVNSLHYPQTIKNIGADFGISPLVPNYFNYSKSAIKYQEYCMSGIVGIGTSFDNGEPSPYDVSVINVSDNITEDEIDDLIFNRLCKADTYNDIINKQYEQIINNDWITESAGYINLLRKIL